MQVNRRILAYSIAFGLLFWIFDAAADAVVFYDGNFFPLLFTEVPAHELYIRSTVFLIFLIFGVAISRLFTQIEERDQELGLFRSLLDEANDSIYVIDPDTGAFLDVNEQACVQLGYEREQLLSMNVSDISSVAEDPKGFSEFLKTRNEGLVEEVEFSHLRADGGTIPVEVSAKTVTVGGRDYQIAIARDISTRKERMRQYRTLVDSLPGIAYRCRNEPDWPMEMVAGRITELCGYFGGEIEQGVVTWGGDIIHPDDQEEVWTEVQEAVETDSAFELTYRITTKDGTEKWVWERGYPVYPLGAESVRLEGFITDITARRRLREDLKESKERYESLFRSIRDAILVADTDRRIINCNPAFEELFGYELSEIQGEPTLSVYHSQEEYEAMGETIRQHMDDPSFTFTIDYEKKSGQVFPGETNVFYLRDPDEEIVGFIGVIRDVTTQINQIKQLQIIDRVLQHNFNNEMNIIQGYTQEILDEGSSDVAPHARKIEETSLRLLDTVKKERRITKFLSDPPENATIDLCTVLDRVAERTRLTHSSVEIDLTCPEGVEVLANLALEDALQELVLNSAVHAEAAVPTVDITVEQGGETASVRVADENPTIPEMERNVLLGEEELSALYHGSGMGLWLVKHIVEHSDGVLEFEERDPQGNVVVLTLPLAEE